VSSLNERIAERKRMYYVTTDDYAVGDGGREYDWSGSIADAWELWREMIDNGHSLFVGQHRSLLRVTVTRDRAEIAEISTAGDVAEAIAAAYLAAMEKA